MMITHKKSKAVFELLTCSILIFSICIPVQVFAELFPGKDIFQLVSESKFPCKTIKEYAASNKAKAVGPLISLLKKQDNWETQKCIAETLAMIDLDKSVSILISSLTDNDLLAASRSANALGVIKDKRAVGPLLTALFESKIPCPAAIALGMIKDPQSFEPLLKGVEHEKHSIRSCSIQGLALYNDPRACEILSDVFMTDTDTIVKTMAREVRESLNCPTSGKSSEKYQIEDGYCDLGQSLIDMVIPLMDNSTDLKEWKSSPELKNAAIEILQGYEHSESVSADEKKNIEMKLAVYYLVVEWVDSTISYQLKMESQTTHQTYRDVTVLMDMKNKMEKLRQLCPDLIFPDYNEMSD